MIFKYLKIILLTTFLLSTLPILKIYSQEYKNTNGYINKNLKESFKINNDEIRIAFNNAEEAINAENKIKEIYNSNENNILRLKNYIFLNIKKMPGVMELISKINYKKIISVYKNRKYPDCQPLRHLPT
jgi:hypothetical protein